MLLFVGSLVGADKFIFDNKLHDPSSILLKQGSREMGRKDVNSLEGLFGLMIGIIVAVLQAYGDFVVDFYKSLLTFYW